MLSWVGSPSASRIHVAKRNSQTGKLVSNNFEKAEKRRCGLCVSTGANMHEESHLYQKQYLRPAPGLF